MTTTSASPADLSPGASLWRYLALAVVATRIVVPLVAVPAIPFLLRDQITLLVALRPQKEFLLVGGGQTRYLGEPGIAPLLLAFLPLGVVAIAAFFAVGRAHQSLLAQQRGPDWLRRALPPHQLELAQRVLARRGVAIAVIGRLAAMPPTILAAAAGTSTIRASHYLAADAAGAFLSAGVAIGTGLALGRAYDDGRLWLTVGGAVLFAATIGLVTWWIRREADRSPAATRGSGPAGELSD